MASQHRAWKNCRQVVTAILTLGPGYKDKGAIEMMNLLDATEDRAPSDAYVEQLSGAALRLLSDKHTVAASAIMAAFNLYLDLDGWR